MVQVEYTKKAYQDAKRTPPKDRTEEQKVLCQIDFRQGPNPILRLSSGSVVVLRPGNLIEADAEGNIGILLEKEPKEKIREEKPKDEKPKQEKKTKESTPEKNAPSINVADFFKKDDPKVD